MARGPGQRAGLTRAAVLAAARDLVAQGGRDALTMRALGRHLHVAPNALYSHVLNKTALVDDLLDDLLAGVDAPSPASPDPVAGLVALLNSTYAVLTAHAELVPLYLERQGARGPNAVRLGAIMDELLTRAGLRGAAIGHARRVLIIHAIGSAAFATFPATQDSDPPLPAQESRRSFDQSLRWLLAGIVQSSTAPAGS